MKTFTKKILSLILSLVMVVTMLPTFAITATANAVDANEHLVGQYLVDGIAASDNHGATWYSNKNEAQFDGTDDYVEVDNPLYNSTTNAFTVSFDYYQEEMPFSWGRYFDFNDESTNKYFGIVTASSDAGTNTWEKFITLFKNGGNELRYYGNDFAGNTDIENAGGYDYKGTAYWGETGVWRNVTVSMSSTGVFSVYIDSNCYVKFNSNYSSVSQAAGLTYTDCLNAVKACTKIIIGGSTWRVHGSGGDAFFKGYMKNFRVFNADYDSLTDAEKLLILMDEYEAKMNGTVYTNMAAAYNAYVDANEAYDAYNYGGATGQANAQVSSAYSALKTAMGNMTVWPEKTANNPAAADGSYSSSGLVASDEMKNVLYTYGVSGSSPYNSSSGVSKCNVGFQYGAIVFLYNGTEMACPINAYVSRAGSGTRRCRSITPLTSGFSLKHNWHSNESTGNTTYQGTTGVISYVDGDTANASLNMGSGNYYYSNTLYLNLDSLATYSTSYTPQFCFRDNNGNYGTNTTGGSVSQGDQTIYVVNYKALVNAINNSTRKGYLANVDDYKEGGLAALTAAYDVATAIDPNSYFSSVSVSDSSADNYVSKCVTNAANAIEAAIEGSNGSGGFDNVGTPTADGYISLRDAIDYSGEPTGIDGGDFDNTSFSVRDVIAANGKYNVVNGNMVLTSSGAKMLTGYSAFSTAYTNAVNVMAALGTAGFNTNSTSNYTDSTAGAKATALINAFNGLSAIDLNKPTVSGQTYLGPDDVITVTDTNSGTASYKWQYSTDNGANWTDGGNIASAGGTFAPFDSMYASPIKIRVVATKSTATEYDNSAGVEHIYFTAPTVSAEDGDVVPSNTTVTLTTTKSGASGTLQYSLNGGAFTDGSSITLFGAGDNSTTATLRAREVIKDGGNIVATSELTGTLTIKRKPNTPTVTPDGDYLDASHGIVVTSNDTSLDTDATLMVSATGENYVTYSSLAPTGKYYPFAGQTPTGTSMQHDLYVKAVRNGAESEVVHITYASLGWPSIVKSSDNTNLAANDELTASDTLYLETSTGQAGGTLKYAFSVDGGSTWSEAKTANGTITPFGETVTIGGNTVNLANKVNITMRAWEERDGSSSGYNVIGPILLKKTEPLTVYYNADSEASTAVVTSTESYNNNGHFFINTDGYTGCQIFYQTKVDGGAWSGFTSYSINGGVDTDTFSTNKIVQIRFFVIENDQKTVFAQGTFSSEKNYSELVFKESFNSASASGSTLTLSGDNGTATAATADSFSVVDGAGYSDGTNSPDWRNNVLKINGSNSDDRKITLATNPLTDAATKYMATKNGVTISFWRYVPDGKFTNTVGTWLPTLSFEQPQGGSGERYYFQITADAYASRSDSAIDKNNDYNKYIDIKPDTQDPTQHATGNQRNRWLNIVVTVDPNSGVTIYTNGEPHNTTIAAGTGGSHGTYSGNNAALAQDILDFITNSSTTMSLANGQGYWSLYGKDLYIDDIRLYTDVKTQVDINNMYIYDADVESDITSTSHDPTNVTVYTLARAVETDSNGTKPIGAKVGQEFIDYYGLNANSSSDVSAVDEYSFGTGMTIYHLNKTTGKWDVVGDNNGKCGYQNEKLFGSVYTTGIADALAAATGSGSSTGAGYLVWAPHVMYNLTTDKWVYYGSTSSWGVQKSAIFMCQNDTNDDVTGPYTYKEISYKSTGHPNAIDACVYYGRDVSGKPVLSQLNMVFGSWGGSNAIASKALNANGTTTGNTSYDKIIAAGISESASSDGGSAEGAWVTYENGYYYLYVSYGQNTGSYAERVFRSTVYNDSFVDLANVPATNTENKMKGNQIISPFDMSNYNYTFKSTGHNSVYKTVNNAGEIVTLHSTHARPNTNANHDWIAIPDNALATCQSEVDGNLNLINQVAYNSLGWPVLMPYQYDGTDTVTANVKGEDIEGVYAADDLRTYVSDTWAPQYNYTIVADEDNDDAAYEYGTDEGGETFTDYIVLSTGADGTRYANYYATKSAYDPENPNNNLEYCGVVGKHGDKICISMICPSDREHTWTYRIGEIPKSEDVDSLGDSVSMDGVIYTHASTAATNNATFTYALYGTEISDDFQYGTSDLHQGERCTTITTTYPAKIDTSSPTAIYCLSDEEIAKSGDYSGGDFRVVALNDDKWFDDSGNRFSDLQAIDLEGVSDQDGSALKRRYGLKGFVSNYYYNSSTGEYQDTGVELIVSYTDVSTGSNYSEFEFCYVSANPSMAHTVSGSRNEHEYALQGDKRAGIILFDRFLGSTGTATNVRSSFTYQYNWDNSNYYKKGHESGIFNYLGEWGSSASLDDSARDYKTPENMANNFHDSTETVNGRTFGSHDSGAFAQIEIDRRVYRDAIATSPVVIDTDYYIDYSNTDNYDINNQYGTITTSAGRPTGYTFTMRTANINWAPQQSRRWGATSYMLNNIVDVKGNKITTNSSYDTNKGDKLPTSPYKPYSQYTDGGNDGETRLYYGNINNTSATKNSNSQTLESGLGEYSTNTTHHRGRDDGDKQFDFEAKYTLGVGDSAIGRKVMSGYFTNPSAYTSIIGGDATPTESTNDYFTKGITATGRDANGNLTYSAVAGNRIEKAFDYIDSGNSATNAWNMHIDFNGKYSVPKNTDTSLPAEQYANFILEQGISTMCWWTGWNTRYEASVQEVYKYYNIGVSTCDKGAARSFAENYLRKQLAVNRNSDGTVTVKRDSNGAPIYLTESGVETSNVADAAIITPANYTLSSYQEYIDAVAELNYFVKNPTNTKFKDYVKTGANASSSEEYVTAYHDGIPYYVTDKGGANIFGDAGTVYTDEVQAQLIENVITAYENLFERTDYTDAQETYASIELLDDGSASTTVANVDEIKIYTDKEEDEYTDYAKGNYTDDSWENFVQLVVDVASAFTYNKDASTGKTSWRYVDLSGSEYRRLEDILEHASETLMPAVDTSELSTAYGNKSGTDKEVGYTGTSVADGIFDDGTGAQQYTITSWNTMKTEVDAANTVLSGAHSVTAPVTITNETTVVDEETVPATRTFDVGKYAVESATKYTFGDDVTFYAQNFTADGALSSSSYKSGDSYINHCSDEQGLVYDKYNDIKDLELAAVDNSAAYETYDDAKKVVDALDMDKYTNAGKGLINTAISTTVANVYATAAELADYNTMFSTSYDASSKIKKTASGYTDPETANLLSTINTVNTEKVGGDGADKDDYKYIKYFLVTFTAQTENQNGGILESIEEPSQKVKYGDSVTLTLPDNSGTESKPVLNWSVSTYNGDYSSGISGSVISSQKLTGFLGRSITRTVNSNLAVVVELDPEIELASGWVQYNILDCYGKISETKYVNHNTTAALDTTTVDGKEIATVSEVTTKVDATPKSIPFYTCTTWTVTRNSDTLITLNPNYSTATTFNYSFVGATTEGVVGAEYDSKVTVEFDDTKGTFAAWAVRIGAEAPYKYQIASYSPEYTFYACTDETYVAIIEDTANSGCYKTTDGDSITASKIEGAITETGSIGADAFINQKIHDNLPFVSVENLVMDGTKVRLYVRITQGASEPTGYGVLFRKDYTGTDENMVIGATGVTRRAVTSRLTSGQFTYTINKSAGFTSGDAVSFRAFVNYNFNYTAASQSTSINALDYSKSLKVQKS